MKTAFLLNPRAKKGTGTRSWSSFEPEIRSRFPRSTVYTPADLSQLEETLCLIEQQHYERVIVVGGDGTVNRVLNLLLTRHPDFAKEVLVGILPMGTGNDLARSIGLTKSKQKNLDILQKSRYRNIDIGQVTFTSPTGEPRTAYFCNMLTLGISTLALEALNQARSPSPFCYMGTLLKKVAHYTPTPIRMYANDHLVYKGPILVASIANGRYIGGGIPLLPAASLQDGKFHTLAITKMPVWKQFCLLPLLCMGKQPFRERVACTVSRVRIESDMADTPFETDGELPGFLPLEAVCLPQAIRLIGAF